MGDVAYTWDAAGRVVGKGDWTFEYGASGELTHASRLGRQIDFVYDDADKRLLKRVDGVPVRANVPGGVLTEDHFVELVVVGGVVAGVLDNGQFTALLTDPRGTPFVGPDGTPGLPSPYGVRTSHLGLAEVVDYTRLGWDPDLDVVRMGVRDYDPKLSQFLTPDPMYFEDLDQCLASPLQCALYGYAGGNPVSFVDPAGLGVRSWLRELAADIIDAGATVAGGVIGGAAGAAAGSPTGPGAIGTTAVGAVAGAGLARGIVCPISDWVRAETPSVRRQLNAGATMEMGGKLVAKGAGVIFRRIRARFGAAGTPASPASPSSIRHLTGDQLRIPAGGARRPEVTHLRDFATRETENWSSAMRTEGEARAFARQKLGPGAVEYEPGKFRSSDGKWQYRAKPGDVEDRHVHLEEIDPATGEVKQNLHLRWPEGEGR